MTNLDHIALYVTNLELSMDFYKTVLRSRISGPYSLGNISASGRLIKKAVSGEHGFMRGALEKISPHTLRNQDTKVAFVSSTGNKNDILLVEQWDPKNKATRSVDGNSIYGFSYTLSPSVDMEILAWDLCHSEVPFLHGDPDLDGTIYSENCKNHSIYIRDPDGRMIELKCGLKNEIESQFIQSLDSVTIYVTSPDTSREFYKGKIGLFAEEGRSTDIGDKRFLWMKNEEGRRLILLYGMKKQDGEPIKTGGYGLDHIGIRGLSGKGKACQVVTDISMNPELLGQNFHSEYICDIDGCWIEYCI